MIGAGSSFWGGAANYLQGNAYVLDGAFDYSTISTWSSLQRNNAVTFNFNVKPSALATFNYLFSQGQISAGTINVYAIFLDAGRPVLLMNSGTAGNRLHVRANTSLTAGAINSVQIVYDGSSNANNVNFYINGVLSAKTIITNTLSLNIAASSTMFMFARNSDANFKFSGLAKSYEIINRVATAPEIAATATTGSFRGAGIAHNSGQYLLAVDFDKTGTVSPTTFAGTPPATIISFGGAAYAPY